MTEQEKDIFLKAYNRPVPGRPFEFKDPKGIFYTIQDIICNKIDSVIEIETERNCKKMKCFICGENIAIDEADMFTKTVDGKYICGKHYIKNNSMIIKSEVVEKLLEEKFGGCATILGDAEFKIYYE